MPLAHPFWENAWSKPLAFGEPKYVTGCRARAFQLVKRAPCERKETLEPMTLLGTEIPGQTILRELLGSWAHVDTDLLVDGAAVSTGHQPEVRSSRGQSPKGQYAPTPCAASENVGRGFDCHL